MWAFHLSFEKLVLIFSWRLSTWIHIIYRTRVCEWAANWTVFVAKLINDEAVTTIFHWPYEIGKIRIRYSLLPLIKYPHSISFCALCIEKNLDTIQIHYVWITKSRNQSKASHFLWYFTSKTIFPWSFKPNKQCELDVSL